MRKGPATTCLQSDTKESFSPAIMNNTIHFPTSFECKDLAVFAKELPQKIHKRRMDVFHPALRGSSHEKEGEKLSD